MPSNQFRVVLSPSNIPMPGRTVLEGEGPGNGTWSIYVMVDAETVDPWPNTTEGGHQVTGTVAFKNNGSIVYKNDNVEFHVWRNANNEPTRIYAENAPTQQDPAWEIGDAQNNNVEYDNDHEEWVFTCGYTGTSGAPGS